MSYNLIRCEVKECGALCHGIPDGKGGLILRCLLHRPETQPSPRVSAKKRPIPLQASREEIRS